MHISMYSYIAYIDESGDDGLGKFRQPGTRGGSSNWLCICACVLRYSQHLEAVKWRDEIKQTTGKRTQGRAIHFADFNHSQKRATCQIIRGKSLRFISAISNKTLIPAGSYTHSNQLYFYLARHVIERLSWFCRDQRASVPEGNGQAKIVFSRRGGLSYEGFKGYLEQLKSDSNPNTIHWPVIDIDNIEAKDHSTDAGLQLADCGASAIASAFEPDQFGNIEAQYLQIIKEIIYNRNNNYMSYGLKLLPEYDRNEFTPDQAAGIQPFR